MDWVNDNILVDFGVEWKKQEDSIYIPNTFFTDIPPDMLKMQKHKLFIFNYYFVTAWIYRYCKAEQIAISNNNDYSGTVKVMSGYSRTNKTIDYIIKEDGVLDTLGMTTTIPISEMPYEIYYNKENKTLDFFTNDKYSQINKKIKGKVPLICLQDRVVNDIEMLGTYYDIDYTFKVSMKDYMFMLNELKLKSEVIAFYYYLKSLIGRYGHKYGIGVERMSKELGISRRTISSYKKILKDNHLLIEFNYNGYETHKVNKYIVKGVKEIYGQHSSATD